MGDTPVDKAFLQLIQQNSGIIYKVCRVYCAAENEREDLAQEIIYQLWKSAKKYDTAFKFTTWMYRVALNTAISFNRTSKKTAGTVSIDGNTIDVADKADGTHVTDDNIKLLQQYINELKDLDKALMILYLEAKSYGEIAYITGLTETNVATKISRIKDKLKQRFLTK